MDPLLIVSPHCDDGALSAGQLMAGRPDCVVVTVFAGAPDDPAISTTDDRNCGFVDAARAVARRRIEDSAALRKLGAVPVHLDFVDGQYRGASSLTAAEISAALATVLNESGATVVLGPLGLAHPDHLLAATAVAQLLDERPAVEAWLYEDQPARVLWPEDVSERLEWWRLSGFASTLDFLGTGPLRAKQAAAACYASQLWALDMHAVLCPERHHRLVRCA